MHHEFVNEVWSRYLRDKGTAYGESDTDELKPLICQCCGGQIDKRTMNCPYCETRYTGNLEPVHIISQSEPYGVQTLHAAVYVDELTFQNQEIAMKIAREKLYEAMMKSMMPYVEIEQSIDHSRFGRTLRGRLKIFTDKGRNNYG